MKSVPELRTHIDELSSAIDAQMRILRDLENKRSKAQSELNSILDPMAKLPVEVSSDIFLLCISDTPRPDPYCAPMLFLNICHLWSDIALATPTLWASIDIESHSRGAHFDELCKIWLSRARNLPLSFILRFRGSVDRCIQNLATEHIPQLQNLELYVDTSEDLQRVEGPFPSLETLAIAAIDRSGALELLNNIHESVEILRAAPVLLECAFMNIYYAEDFHSFEPELLTHTCLQHLRLGKPQNSGVFGEEGSNSAYILRYLTLPALKSLEIANLDIENDEFLSFLTRSSPPLQSLRVVIPTNHGPSYTGMEYLRLLPSLTDLDLFCPPTFPIDNHPPLSTFLKMLGDAGDVLPRLRNLTILTRSAYISEHTHLESMTSALAARSASRHGSLQCLRLVFPTYDAMPNANVIFAIRPFAKDGMHIHVGPEDCNFI
ncbi:hypothetical protein B0H13DRAFT_2075542 [Mycena leptocephala]|nr:hypothetical protein B0H13DRAFT_2075542 [Mycena leptocephala]